MQERFTAPLLPVNTHWIPSLVTLGIGSFTMVKEMVTGSPMLIGLLLTPSDGDTSGGTAESSCNYLDFAIVHGTPFIQYHMHGGQVRSGHDTSVQDRPLDLGPAV